MSQNTLLLCLFATTAYFAAFAVAREAIVGGNLSEANQFPYQVSVLIPTRGGHICGGGIISDDLILTAARCVIEADGSFLRHIVNITAGTNNLLQEGLPAVTAVVEKIYVPRVYNRKNRLSPGDIAVLRLRQSLALYFHRHLRQLFLPENDHEYFNGQRAVIAGWGLNNIHQPDGHGIAVPLLRFAQTDVIAHGQHGYPRGRNPHHHICARVIQRPNQSSRGVCLGDIGGPLVHNGIVIGVLSVLAPQCSEYYEAATYTRVSSYLNFIEDAILDRHHHDIIVHQ